MPNSDNKEVQPAFHFMPWVLVFILFITLAIVSFLAFQNWNTQYQDQANKNTYQTNSSATLQPTSTVTPSPTTQASDVPLSSSDQTSDLNQDLNQTDVDSLSTDLKEL